MNNTFAKAFGLSKRKRFTGIARITTEATADPIRVLRLANPIISFSRKKTVARGREKTEYDQI